MTDVDNPRGPKIGCSMKLVDQSDGTDLDPQVPQFVLRPIATLHLCLLTRVHVLPVMHHCRPHLSSSNCRSSIQSVCASQPDWQGFDCMYPIAGSLLAATSECPTGPNTECSPAAHTCCVLSACQTHRLSSNAEYAPLPVFVMIVFTA